MHPLNEDMSIYNSHMTIVYTSHNSYLGVMHVAIWLENISKFESN